MFSGELERDLELRLDDLELRDELELDERERELPELDSELLRLDFGISWNFQRYKMSFLVFKFV